MAFHCIDWFIKTIKSWVFVWYIIFCSIACWAIFPESTIWFIITYSWVVYSPLFTANHQGFDHRSNQHSWFLCWKNPPQSSCKKWEKMRKQNHPRKFQLPSPKLGEKSLKWHHYAEFFNENLIHSLKLYNIALKNDGWKSTSLSKLVPFHKTCQFSGVLSKMNFSETTKVSAQRPMSLGVMLRLLQHAQFGLSGGRKSRPGKNPEVNEFIHCKSHEIWYQPKLHVPMKFGKPSKNSPSNICCKFEPPPKNGSHFMAPVRSLKTDHLKKYKVTYWIGISFFRVKSCFTEQ